MNLPSKLPTLTYPRGHPPEFEQIIHEKSENFVGREFVFAAIAQFLNQQDRGYFSLVGSPGSGKSSILAKYVTEHPNVIYYNAQIAGKNQVDQFLTSICTQLIDYLRVIASNIFIENLNSKAGETPTPQDLWSRSNKLVQNLNSKAGETPTPQDLLQISNIVYDALPDNVTDGSWFLSLLLQKISDRLEPNQRLIIAIDGLDAIDRNNQPPGANLFYLPRYLPNNVYFILARRPFLREKSGLLIETPSRIFDLQDYPVENQTDVQKYIEANLKSLEPELRENITDLCENNFMWLKCVVEAIAQTSSPNSLDLNQLPASLETYYQQHWQKMQEQNLSAVELAVVQTIIALPSTQKEGISAQFIAEIIDTDEYEIEQVLENWLELLTKKQINSEWYYRLYHSSFCQWLGKQIVTIIRLYHTGKI